MDKSLNIRLKKSASDLNGELGQIPFERVLRRHLDLFSDLRTSGASWQMIATALANVGVLRRNKLPMSAAQIRGVVSRQLARSDRVDRIGGSLALVPRLSPPRASKPVIDASSVFTSTKRASNPPLHTPKASRSVQLDPKDRKQAADGMSAPPAQIVPPPPDRSVESSAADIRAYMAHASRLRKPNAED